mgnify:CR=1 FL=1
MLDIYKLGEDVLYTPTQRVTKFDSALKPQRIIRLYQTSNDPNISKNKEDGRQQDKPM